MHAAKAGELLKDTEVMSQTFERLVDRKDAIIRSLAKDLEEAEEQYPSHNNRLPLEVSLSQWVKGQSSHVLATNLRNMVCPGR